MLKVDQFLVVLNVVVIKKKVKAFTSEMNDC